MSKKVFTTITGLVLILSLYTQSIPGNSLLSASAECIEDTKSADIVKDYETINEDEALSTAVQLFSDYIEENSTDWKKVQHENLDRDPVKSLEDYKIVNAKLVYHEGNSFTVRVTYDVKCTDESDMWFAGNGNKEENNWIRNKTNYINIEKNNANYSIKNIYT
ncbi:hypothetical protein [uncultured Clostridium sp.]|uniref:hypothetical protein n=1 Tax=uncultured Clostridium sp. TaxID=59620 RepID=UPI0025D559F1|nr:hypothetical protein [uncultured Clostridium sp.]